MRELLEKYLKIYVHESGRFLWISAIFFVVFFVTAIFRNYVDTAFLKRFGADYIPSMLVLNALLTFVVLGVLERLGRGWGDHVLLSVFLVIYAVATAGLFFMVKAGISLAYPILYQLLYLLDSILLVYLWNIAGDLFDARQGKRIFPLITASQVLGTTLGSFLTRPFTHFFGEDPTLLLFSVISLGVAVFMGKTSSGVLTGAAPKTLVEKKTPAVIKLRQVPALMKQYPIVRYLIITGLIPNILLPIFFYQFSVIANGTFHSEQSLISFLSLFRGMTTALTFVLLFFVGRMYTSLGITNSSLVQPINFSILFAGLVGSFSIYVAAYGQFTTILIQRAIAGPVNKILYSIIPSDLVLWSRSFIRGTVLKVGMLSGSLIMIFLKPIMTAQHFSIIAVILAFYWTLESIFFRKHYKRILKQVITEKQIDFDQIEQMRTFDSGPTAMELGAADTMGNIAEDKVESAKRPAMQPEIALKLLDDDNPQTRSAAAASFTESEDMRAVARLMKLLEDNDDEVRAASIEALVSYGGGILPFLEVYLIRATPRAKQGILEVIRLSNVHGFEFVPFLGKELSSAYSNLIALRQMQAMNTSLSMSMLREHLAELNEEILSLVFYALWVNHADMRLMYQALRSETASIAVELIENSIQKELSPYIIPLIEDIPLNEKIEEGKKLFPLIRQETPERLLTFLADSADPVTRMLALFVIGEQQLGKSFIPVIDLRIDDSVPYVRQIAEYAMKRTMKEAASMPDVIEKINRLRTFTIFEGMGIRELHAIASVINVEIFSPGDIVIKEGEENSSIYLIVNGSIAVYQKYGTNEQKEKAVIGEGTFLGELSLFTRLAPNATCVAVEESQAYVLRHHQFQEIMKVYPQIGINLCRFFTMKLRQVAY